MEQAWGCISHEEIQQLLAMAERYDSRAVFIIAQAALVRPGQLMTPPPNLAVLPTGQDVSKETPADAAVPPSEESSA